MKFEKKSLEEISKMSPEEKEKYFADKESHDTGVRKDEIEKAVKPVTESVEKVQTIVGTIETQLKTIDENLNAVEQKISSGSANKITTKEIETAVDKWLDDNIDKIKETFKSGRGKIDLSEVEKAVGIVTTANGTLPTALPANFAVETLGVPNVRLRRPSLLDRVNTFNTNKVSLPYVEAIPGEGDFAVVAEGESKPQLDLDWVTRYVSPSKFAGWIKVTEEAIDDIPRLRDMIVNYLKAKHDLFKEKQVFSYINTNATAYATAGALAGTVVDPNIIDVVNALQVQIINSPNYTDEPDFYADTVLMNVVDFYTYFAAKKDSLGRPLYSDKVILGGSLDYNGLTFMSTSLVTAGNVIVFDSTKIDVSTYIPYHVEIGWVNDDFIKNQFVILGESRGHIYIKNHDKRAFVKGSIAAIIEDLAVEEEEAA